MKLFGKALWVGCTVLVFSFTRVITADSFDHWHWRSPLPQGNALNNVAFGDGLFLAVGSSGVAPFDGGGTVMISSDAKAWAICPSSASTRLNGAAYGNGAYITVGNAGTILTSLDGVSWIPASSPTSNSLQSVSFLTGMFIVVGVAGTIITSSDGNNWVTRVSGVTRSLRGVAFGNGLFVAVGDDGTVLTSNDAIIWLPQSSGTSRSMLGIAFGQGLFVAVGDRDFGRIISSSDGVNWTTRRNNDPSEPLLSIAYGGGRFVAGALAAPPLVSDDGIHWTKLGPLFVPRSATGITYADGRFLATGSAGSLWVSTTSSDWTDQRVGFVVPTYSMTYGNGRFLADGATSTNGIDWVSQNTSGLSYPLNAIVFGNGIFVGVGQQEVGSCTNGFDWSSTASSIPADIFIGVAYDSETFVAVGRGGSILASDDGANWITRQQPDPARYPTLFGVAGGNGTFVATSTGGVIFASSDTINWTNRVLDPNDQLSGISFANGAFVIVGNSNIFTSPNGTNWSSLTRGPGPAPDGNNIIYANGAFAGPSGGKAVLTSTDLVNWVAHDTGSLYPVQSVASDGITIVAASSGFLQSDPFSNTSPDLIQQPRSATNAVGSTVVFSITASGTSPIECQWEKDGTPIVGATNSTLALHRIQFSDAGHYQAVLTNTAGKASSQAARLAIPAQLDIQIKKNAELTIAGVLGSSYRVEYSELGIGMNDWKTLTTLRLQVSPFQWEDSESPTVGGRIYRLVEDR